VGRDSELSTVGRVIDSVSSGPIGLVIEGPPGIGKTTVWQHGLGQSLARGYQMLSCRPNESETVLSFSGLTDLLDSVPDRTWCALPELQREALEIALLKQPAPESDSTIGRSAWPSGTSCASWRRTVRS
jgi:hypothetical protein